MRSNGQDVVAFAQAELPDLNQMAEMAENLARNTAASLQERTTDPFLRLLKSGQWVYGQQNVEVEDGSLWAWNPMSLAHGYISWLDSEVEGEQMVPMMTTPLPALADLGEPPGEPWQRQYGCQLVCVAGEDTGQQVVYKGTSLGLKDTFALLVPQIQKRMADGDPCVPVTRLEVDSYKHKKWGMVYKPKVMIDHWAQLSGEPAKDTTKDAEPPFDTEAEPEEQPRRRRRARA